MLAAWSLRVFIITAGAWLILGTVYFARPSHPLLPAPLNVLLFVALASLATGALAAWFACRILEHLTGQNAKLEAVADAMEARDGRLYFELARVRGEVTQLRDLIEQTMDLGRRPALAVVGAAVAPAPGGIAPDVVDLTRKIHQKMLEGDEA